VRRRGLAILLPPSEGKAIGGGRRKWSPDDGRFGTALGAYRLQLAEALAAAGGGDERLLGVGGSHLVRARQANVALVGARSVPAWQRYTGVVWDHLDVATLTPPARALASKSVVVISGLLGLVALDDPTPDYRLKIGARPPAIGTLSKWWAEPVSAALNGWLEGKEVVDLLPNEHRAAWKIDRRQYARLYRIGFVERNGKIAGHDAKAAKGLFARHLLESVAGGASTTTALATFTHARFDLAVTG
jgi:uncharacterized protein